MGRGMKTLVFLLAVLVVFGVLFGVMEFHLVLHDTSSGGVSTSTILPAVSPGFSSHTDSTFDRNGRSGSESAPASQPKKSDSGSSFWDRIAPYLSYGPGSMWRSAPDPASTPAVGLDAHDSPDSLVLPDEDMLDAIQEKQWQQEQGRAQQDNRDRVSSGSTGKDQDGSRTPPHRPKRPEGSLLEWDSNGFSLATLHRDEVIVLRPRRLSSFPSADQGKERKQSSRNAQPTRCENTLDSGVRRLAADSLGQVCLPHYIDPESGCCAHHKALVPTLSHDHLSRIVGGSQTRLDPCFTCRADLGCCREQALCISCCMRREKLDQRPNSKERIMDVELFADCMHRCRTSSRSLEGGTSYKRSLPSNQDSLSLRHCYSASLPKLAYQRMTKETLEHSLPTKSRTSASLVEQIISYTKSLSQQSPSSQALSQQRSLATKRPHPSPSLSSVSPPTMPLASAIIVRGPIGRSCTDVCAALRYARDRSDESGAFQYQMGLGDLANLNIKLSPASSIAEPAPLMCHQELLPFVNSCQILRKFIGCSTCRATIAKHTPSIAVKGSDHVCFYNSKPSYLDCTTSHPKVSRLCPCIPGVLPPSLDLSKYN